MGKIHLTIFKQSFICNFAIKTQVHSARHLSLFMSKLHMCLKLIVTMKSINTTLEYLHILHIGFHLIIKNSKRPQFQRRIRVLFCLSHVLTWTYTETLLQHLHGRPCQHHISQNLWYKRHTLGVLRCELDVIKFNNNTL